MVKALNVLSYRFCHNILSVKIVSFNFSMLAFHISSYWFLIALVILHSLRCAEVCSSDKCGAYPGGHHTYTRKMRTPMAAGCDALYIVRAV